MDDIQNDYQANSSGIFLPKSYTIFKKPNEYEITNRRLEELRHWSELIQWGRRNPCLFAEYIFGVEFMDYQKYVFTMSWNTPYVVWCMGRGSGKALSLDTPIPTPTGYTTMGELKIGDYVLGDDGKPTKVLNVSEVFHNHDCYEVTFDDGEKIIADREHIWNVNKRRNHRTNEIVNLDLTTEELLVDYVKTNRGFKEHKYFVNLNKPIEYPERELPIHPYILGAWLGDGSSYHGCITSSKLDYLDMVDCIESTGYKVSSISNDTNGNKKLFIADENGVPLITKLKEYGFYKNKHLPIEYLQSSYEQRYDLLKGLMDTDDTASSSKAGNCEFSQKSESFIRAFEQLLGSLGIRHNTYNHTTKSSKDGDKEFESFRTCFYVNKEHTCFKFKRKTDRLPEQIHQKHAKKFITNIVKVESVPTKCIYVDNESHLYLCGNKYTVTHNSILGSILIMTKTLLIPDHVTYILCGVGSQSIELFTKIEKFVHNQIPSFDTLTDVYQSELQKSANSNGFVHNPASYTYKLYNNSQVFTLNGSFDNNRSKYLFERVCFASQK